MSNTLELVREVVLDPRLSGFAVAVFGGWAEELLAVIPPRHHADIDLLIFDADTNRLDAFLAQQSEIVDKRLSHKRAFTTHGVMVELFLVVGDTTTFWDRLLYRWPEAEPIEVDGLPVAPRDYLAAYRRDYATIRAATTC